MASTTSQSPALGSTSVSTAASRVGDVRAILAEHRSVFVLLLGYLVYAFAIDAMLTEHQVVNLRLVDDLFLLMLEVYSVAFLLGYLPWAMRRVPAGQPVFTTIFARFRASYLRGDRLLRFVLMILYARVLTDVFVSLKAAIPLLHPYSWDETFMRWDRTLHFGVDPWRLLAPLSAPAVTAAINFLYNSWIFLLFMIFIWQAWSANLMLRKRFFLTFGLSWILLGTFTATLLSSAGPCYYGRVVGGQSDPYAEQMAGLRAIDQSHPVWALAVQETLWVSYQEQQKQAGLPTDETASSTTAVRAGLAAASEADPTVKKMLSGISAMPSMHVAMAVLFALLGWQVGRFAGVAFTAFAVVTQIGSVHLGWHYALDGYSSAIVVVTLWWAVGRWLVRLPAPCAAPPLRSPLP